MPTYKQIKSLIKQTSLIVACSASTSLHAQDTDSTSNPFVNNSQSLTLFEDVETAESRTRATGRPTRESRATTAEPEFTLVGVSRIGDVYSALLRSKDGESFSVRTNPGVNTLIPAHSDFAVVDVSASSVSIRYPSNNACIEFTDRGVSCNSAANIAELVLANGEPLAARNPATANTEPESASDSEEVVGGEITPGNPFEALRNGRRGDSLSTGTTATSTTGARFTPRRISPEDIPEGKRVVATPFGDRLVDE